MKIFAMCSTTLKHRVLVSPENTDSFIVGSSLTVGITVPHVLLGRLRRPCQTLKHVGMEQICNMTSMQSKHHTDVGAADTKRSCVARAQDESSMGYETRYGLLTGGRPSMALSYQGLPSGPQSRSFSFLQ
jgi:hypothetical protein